MALLILDFVYAEVMSLIQASPSNKENLADLHSGMLPKGRKEPEGSSLVIISKIITKVCEEV